MAIFNCYVSSPEGTICCKFKHTAVHGQGCLDLGLGFLRGPGPTTSPPDSDLQYDLMQPQNLVISCAAMKQQ